MTFTTIKKYTPLRFILIYIICTVPTMSAFLAVATDASFSLWPPSQTSSLQRTTKMQQHEKQSITDSSSTDAGTTTMTNNNKSDAPPMFSPTSKYHPNQNSLSQRRRWLVVDFDGTCTEQDTTPLLPRLAAFAAHRQRSSIVSVAAESGGDKQDINADIYKQDLEQRLSQFQILEDEFNRRFSEAKSTLLPGEDEGGEVEGEERQRSIHEVLDALDAPSTIVTQMVSESRILNGLGHADARELEGILQLHGVTGSAVENGVEKMDAAVEEDGADGKNSANDDGIDKIVVRLRHGCEGTLARILSDDKETNKFCLGWSLAVLSINWCPALIDATLIQPVLKKRRSILGVVSCETEIPVWSNHVNEEGIVSLHVPGALAKRDRIMELRQNIQLSDDSSSSGVIVYVGDSSTDLAALLEADIGIIMGQSSSTTMIAERWGVKLVPLRHRGQHGFGSSLEEDVGNWRKRKMLWTVESWQEIDEMLTELDEYWS